MRKLVVTLFFVFFIPAAQAGYCVGGTWEGTWFDYDHSKARNATPAFERLISDLVPNGLFFADRTKYVDHGMSTSVRPCNGDIIKKNQ